MKTELFENALQTGRNLKMPGFCFRVDREHLENGAIISKAMASRKSCDFPDLVFLKHKSKMSGDRCVLKFPRCSVDGKHLMRFQSENAVLKFPWGSVDGVLLYSIFFVVA